MILQEKVALYLKAKQAYYFEVPIMSDAQFDKLEDDIRAASPAEPALKIVGAPVPKSTPHKKGTHSIPMGSQEKVNTFEELQKWERLRANQPEARFHVSYKADGGSLGLYYYDGRLDLSLTRGDGTEGENISAQAGLFQGVPLQLSKPLNIGVRCEAIVTLQDWPLADPEQRSNPRNVATGILGRLDGEKALYITTLAFDLDHIPGTNDEEELPTFASESEKSAFIESLGFLTVPSKGNLTLEKVKAFYEETNEKREKGELPYWIDGIIVRYEDIELQKELGITDSRPKGQVAWKFPAAGALTTLRSVSWQVGHTGAVTPIAAVDPVRIGGSTVKSPSLANADNIKTLGAFIGAEVYVIKAGDIIPQVIEVKSTFDAAKGHQQIEIPTTCPTCQSTLEKRKNVDGSDSVVLFCPSNECPDKITGKIDRYCTSRNLLGLGDSIIVALAQNKIVKKVPDLYRLTPEMIENLPMNTEKGTRLGRKRAEAICAEIAEKGRKMSLAEFLGAFGTRALGVRRATLMLASQPRLEDFENWFNGKLCETAFSQVAGVPKLGAVIHEGLLESESIIRETLAFVELTQPNSSTAGKKTYFCITGSLPSGKKKKDYLAPLDRVNCGLLEDLTKDVNYLVLADPNGPDSAKTKKAKKLGIPLMSEEDLVKFIEAEEANKDATAAPPVEEPSPGKIPEEEGFNRLSTYKLPEAKLQQPELF